MPGKQISASDVLGRARSSLSDAEYGWLELTGARDPRRVLAGMKAMVTSGRRVTFVLQKLRSIEPGFDGWYMPIQDGMKADPLMRYFNTLRSTIEKEGLPNGCRAMLDLIRDGEIVVSAEVAFGEDPRGVWISGRATTTTEVKEFGPEYERRLRDICLPNPPAEHLGLALADPRIDVLGRLFLDYLAARVVEPAIARFTA